MLVGDTGLVPTSRHASRVPPSFHFGATSPPSSVFAWLRRDKLMQLSRVRLKAFYAAFQLPLWTNPGLSGIIQGNRPFAYE